MEGARHMRDIGLVAERGARRWDAVSSDRAELGRAARAAGIEVDVPLPRAQRRPGVASVPAQRVASVSWCASG